MLFDPKPVIPPVIFSGLGAILTLVGLGTAFTIWASIAVSVFPSRQWLLESGTWGKGSLVSARSC